MSTHGPELEPFRCEVVPDRETVRVRPVGALDLATVPLVDAQLADLWSVGFTRLVLDLRDVPFLDSDRCATALVVAQLQRVRRDRVRCDPGSAGGPAGARGRGRGRAPDVLVVRRVTRA